MDRKEPINIRLVVEDESSLYQHFSPEDEFSESVKGYIRSKLICKDDHQSIALTVMSRDPLNEERFRSAVSNWLREEKAIYRKKEKDLIHMLVVDIILATVLVTLSLALQRLAPVVRYSVLPVLASLALSSAARSMLRELPMNTRLKALITEMEQNSRITFEYDDGQTAQRCNPTVPTGGAE